LLEGKRSICKIAKIRARSPVAQSRARRWIVLYCCRKLADGDENELPFTMKEVILCVKRWIIGFRQPKNVLMLIESKQQNIPEGKISNYQNEKIKVLAFYFTIQRPKAKNFILNIKWSLFRLLLIWDAAVSTLEGISFPLWC
jgi:hypothetical protein